MAKQTVTMSVNRFNELIKAEEELKELKAYKKEIKKDAEKSNKPPHKATVKKEVKEKSK